MSSQTISSRAPLSKAFAQALAVCLVAACAGLGFNQLRSEPLPLTADYSAKTRLAAKLGEDAGLGLDEAKALQAGHKAVFLDARAEEEFSRGHIMGAFNAPPLDLGGLREKALAGLAKNTPIVAYCDGEACELSSDLAKDLREQGYTNVRVLQNGWSVWKAAGLPTEQGS